MESAADQQTGGDGRGAGLLDLTRMPLPMLFGLAGSDAPVARALRRRLSEDHNVLSAFQSARRANP